MIARRQCGSLKLSAQRSPLPLGGPAGPGPGSCGPAGLRHGSRRWIRPAPRGVRLGRSRLGERGPARRRSAPCASMPSARAQDGRAYGATRNPRAPLEARTTTMPSSATKAIEYGAALRSSGDSEPGSLMAVAAMARF